MDVNYRRGERNGKNQQQPTTTFFVSNLPGNVSRSLLWRAFLPHGVVKDTYVAKKRDNRGNYFGFVRLEGVTNTEMVLKGMNEIKIFEAKLSVSVARYDKNHRRFEQNPPPVTATKYVPANGQPTNIAACQTNRFYTGAGPSFCDVANPVKPGAKNRKTLLYNERMALYPAHCMMRSVLVEAINLKVVKGIRRKLDEGGYKENAVSYIGGLTFLISFREKREALVFIREKEDLWKSLFSEAVLWEGQDTVFSRLAWLKIMGAPIQAREDKFFDRVGELFGKVVWGSDFSWSIPDNSVAKCCVITDVRKRLDEVVDVEWDGKKFQLWVSEFENEEFGSTLVELSQSKNEDDAGSEESVAPDKMELEEGEFRRFDAGSPEKTSPEVEGSVGLRMADKKAAVGNNVHEGFEEVHGERNDNMRAQTPMAAKGFSTGDTNFMDDNVLFNKSPFNMGTNKEVGQGSLSVSRKRARCLRSPTPNEPEDCDKGAQGEPCLVNLEPSLDLNTPVINDSVTAENSSASQPDTIRNQSISPPSPGQANRLASSLATEVAATIQVGVSVGFQLTGKASLVEGLIEEEGQVMGDGEQVGHP
ncbi:putative RNA recognition motif domain, nucleotide-binding alpha-beta plait domain superfamily [Helianthus annuus]|nr:putative RNA recognition motif domain, nucleotide-binding alpha-beta plait domain superfamily [Helianthus annuus]KAJ0624370.1 putative RNA recognition motif domain, nucleotide-binding alpha-beta plait domain superfamily [Helianthus annuus]